MIYRYTVLFILSVACLTNCLAETSAPDYKSILASCDAARGNLAGVQWNVDVTETSENHTDSRSLLVKARGFDMVAETLSPARQKGHKLLLVQNNMWFYKPGLSKPVPISLRQKLTGQAANGDIASTNYAEDYDIISVNNAEQNGEPCYLFKLKAASRSATYENIDYWVSKERSVGIRADYYTSSGKKRLKTSEMKYENTVSTEGKTSPFISEMIIQDTLTSNSKTTLNFTEPKLGEISNRTFNINSLTR